MGGKLIIILPFVNLRNKRAYSLCFDNWKKITETTDLSFFDLFVWNKKNRNPCGIIKGSFPYPKNIHSWLLMNESILVFQKSEREKEICEKSIISREEWSEWRKPVWDIALNFVKEKTHSANFPPELVKRLVRMYSFVDDVILDPFAGNGTTLKVARELGRNWVGYELYEHYWKSNEQTK